MSLDISLDRKNDEGEMVEVFDANITHNLNQMASEAGIYEIIWHPEEAGVKQAEELIAPLRKAIAEMKADPKRFEKYDAENGWGLLEHFLPWLEHLLVACEEYPDAVVSARR